MKDKALSIQAKIMAALTAVFIAVLISTSLITFFNERQMVDEVLVEQLSDTAASYFDSVNTMMLTGTISQRDVLRNKILDRPNIIDARIIRNKGVDALLDATTARKHELPVDDLDRRALKGEEIIQQGKDAKGRTLTLVRPLKAGTNYRGTNCLTCHQVKENTVLGAVRIDVSLARIDKSIQKGLAANAFLNLALFAGGLAIFAWLFRYLVSNRIRRLRTSLDRIADEADLSTRITIQSNDEIGRVSAAFNHMADNFFESIQQVAGTTHRLNDAAEEINGVVEQTVSSVQQQQADTDSVATAINELSATAQQVRESAQRAAEVSVTADTEAKQGTQVTTDVINGIRQLMDQISSAAAVIEQLAARSNDVGGVLDVIKSIAEQTNLLALNAAIEAARAGEQGRGFAVVADEVRSLATRSHESTQEIENMIAQLQEGAQSAVVAMQAARESAQERSDQVQQAASNLNTIGNLVADIRQLNSQMDIAAQEQSTVTESISHNISRITQLADTTSNDAQRTAAVSEELVHLAHQLEEMIDRFKLG